MSENKNIDIPHDAVEAAAKEIDAPSEPAAQEIARRALEAAAPYMLQSAKAEAWDEGESAGASNHAAEEYPWLPIISNPYRTNNEKG